MSTKNGILEALAITEASAADSSMFGGTNSEEGEEAGKRFRAAALARGFPDDEIKSFCRALSPGDSVCAAYSSWSAQGEAALKRIQSEFLLGFVKACL